MKTIGVVACPATPEVLISNLHGQLLRALSNLAGVHFQGLSQASRHAQFCLNGKHKRILRDLDVTFAFIRHVTEAKASETFVEITKAATSGVGTQHYDLESSSVTTEIAESHLVLQDSSSEGDSTLGGEGNHG